MGDDGPIRPSQYTILLSPKADKDLGAPQGRDRERIDGKIAALADNPRPPGAIKLTAQEGYRLRTGDWRIIYLIDDEARRVIISRVKRRNESTY